MLLAWVAGGAVAAAWLASRAASAPSSSTSAKRSAKVAMPKVSLWTSPAAPPPAPAAKRQGLWPPEYDDVVGRVAREVYADMGRPEVTGTVLHDVTILTLRDQWPHERWPSASTDPSRFDAPFDEEAIVSMWYPRQDPARQQIWDRVTFFARQAAGAVPVS